MHATSDPCVHRCAAEAEPDHHAERLTALAQEARLLEFGVHGDSDAARDVAAEIEGALTHAMDADSSDELTRARDALDAALTRVARLGLSFNAQLSDMEVGGILGRQRMPVLTAVLSA
jgi:hypothetical protein